MINLRKRAVRAGLFAREWASELTSGVKCTQNIYHACIQKTGSQWVKAIFSDPEIVKKSGLKTHPQFRYEVGEFRKKFPKYTFVPGLYVPYQLYKEINKPRKYKTLYVVRDPRDIVVSWYYSMKYTHADVGRVKEHRRKLKKLDEKKGIEYCIRHLQWKFSFIRTWWNNKSNPDIYVVKFEDLTKNPIDEWSRVFDHCCIEVNKKELKKILNRYTKEKMRKRDLKGKNRSISHYRKNKKTWKEISDKRHNDIFHEINGNILNVLGYK
jgi:hypothetical protein